MDTARVAELEQKLAAQDATFKKYRDTAKVKIVKLVTGTKKLMLELDKMKTSSSSTSSGGGGSTSAELEALKATLAQKEARLKRFQDVAQQLKVRHESAQKQIAELTAEKTSSTVDDGGAIKAAMREALAAKTKEAKSHAANLTRAIGTARALKAKLDEAVAAASEAATLSAAAAAAATAAIGASGAASLSAAASVQCVVTAKATITSEASAEELDGCRAKLKALALQLRNESAELSAKEELVRSAKQKMQRYSTQAKKVLAERQAELAAQGAQLTELASALEAEKTAKASALVASQRAAAQLTEDVEAAREASRSSSTDAADAHATLTATLRREMEELRRAHNEAAVLSSDQAHTAQAEHAAQIAVLRGELNTGSAAASTEMDALRAALDAARASHEASKEQAGAAKAASERGVQQYEERIAALRSDCDASARAASELDARREVVTAVLQRELATHSERVATLSAERAEAEAAAQSLGTLVEGGHVVTAEVERALSTAQRELEQQRGVARDTEAVLMEAQTELAEVERRADAANGDATALQQRLESQLVALQTDATAGSAKLASTEHEAATLRGKLAAALEESNTQQRSCASLTAQLKETAEQERAAAARVVQLTLELESSQRAQEASGSENVARIAELNSQLGVAAEQERVAAARVVQLTMELEALERVLEVSRAEQNARVAALESQVSESVVQENAVAARAMKLGQELEASSSESAARTKALETQLASARKFEASKSSESEQLFAELNDSVAAKSVEVERLVSATASQLMEHEGKLATLESALKESKEAAAKYSAKAKSILSGLNAKVQAENARVIELQEAAVSATARDEELSAQVATLTSQTVAKDAELSSIASEMSEQQERSAKREAALEVEHTQGNAAAQAVSDAQMESLENALAEQRALAAQEHETAQRLSGELTEKQARVESLVRSAEASGDASSTHVATIESELSEARGALKRLEKRAAISASLIANLKTKTAASAAVVLETEASLRSELLELRTSETAVAAEAADALKAVRDELVEVQFAFEDASDARRVAELKREKACGGLKVLQESISLKTSRVEELEVEVAGLIDVRTVQAERVAAASAAHSERASEAASAVTRLKEELKAAQNQCASAVLVEEARASETSERMKLLLSELAAAREETGAANDSVKVANLRNLSDEMKVEIVHSEMTERVAQFQMELLAAQNEIDESKRSSAEQADHVASLRNELATSFETEAQMKADLRAAQSEIDESAGKSDQRLKRLTSLEEELAASMKEGVQVVTELDAARKEINASAGSNATHVALLQKELAQSVAEVAKKEQTMAKYSAKAKSVLSDLKGKVSKKTARIVELESLAAATTLATAEASAHAESAGVASVRVVELEVALKTVQTELIESQLAVEDAGETSRTSELKLKSCRKKLELTAKQLAAKKATLAMQESAANAMEAKIESYTHSVELARDEMAAVAHERETLHAKSSAAEEVQSIADVAAAASESLVGRLEMEAERAESELRAQLATATKLGETRSVELAKERIALVVLKEQLGIHKAQHADVQKSSQQARAQHSKLAAAVYESTVLLSEEEAAQSRNDKLERALADAEADGHDARLELAHVQNTLAATRQAAQVELDEMHSLSQRNVMAALGSTAELQARLASAELDISQVRAERDTEAAQAQLSHAQASEAGTLRTLNDTLKGEVEESEMTRTAALRDLKFAQMEVQSKGIEVKSLSRCSSILETKVELLSRNLEEEKEDAEARLRAAEAEADALHAQLHRSKTDHNALLNETSVHSSEAKEAKVKFDEMAVRLEERSAAAREHTSQLAFARAAASTARSAASEHAAALATLKKSASALRTELEMVQPKFEVERQTSKAREQLLRESIRNGELTTQSLQTELHSAQLRLSESDASVAALKAAAATSAWVSMPPPSGEQSPTTSQSPRGEGSRAAGGERDSTAEQPSPDVASVSDAVATAGGGHVIVRGSGAAGSNWKQLLAKQQALVVGSSVKGVNGLYLATASVELPGGGKESGSGGKGRVSRRPVAFEKLSRFSSSAAGVSEWRNAFDGEESPRGGSGSMSPSGRRSDDDTPADAFLLRCQHKNSGGTPPLGEAEDVANAARWQLSRVGVRGDTSALFVSAWLKTKVKSEASGSAGKPVVPTIPVQSWKTADNWLTASHARSPEVFTVHPVLTIALVAKDSDDATPNAMLVVGCTVPGATSTSLPQVCSWFHAPGGGHVAAGLLQSTLGAIRLEVAAPTTMASGADELEAASEQIFSFALCIDSLSLRFPLALDTVCTHVCVLSFSNVLCSLTFFLHTLPSEPCARREDARMH